MQRIARMLMVGAVVASTVALGATPAMAGGDSHIVLPGQSIQAAVDAADPGDSIQLLAGAYAGGVKVTKHGIRIHGIGPETVIEPMGANGCAGMGPESGICVLGSPGQPVHGVTVELLTVRGFEFGVFGVFTDRLTVRTVHAVDNPEYGIAEFESTRGEFVGNVVTGTTDDAGIYVGDTANAYGTKVSGNHVSGGALGILVRHAHHVKVSANNVVDNCLGIVLVDDGQPGGMGHNEVSANNSSGNNRYCAPNEEVPPLQGTGIALIGGQHNAVSANIVHDNLGGPVPFPGGIVLAAGAEHTLVSANVLHGNLPADLVDDSGNATNVFQANHCGSSQPAGNCVP
ncbi:right-handed parallel beta-helix repeat-containing protein [Longispora sp. NPDC051575]|uniref:right-handed parallel beta-helix repeat-containing protein n=1 Tax=Longispora sp. NPDC051575 TaxID=3154943 RepID=UPI003428C1ED